MRIAYTLTVISSLLFAAGCATPDRHASDRALEDNIRAELTRYGDLAVNEPQIHIHARDGTVTLRGHVRSEKDREMIDSLVRNTGGVFAVNDELQVAYPPTGTAQAYPSSVPVYVSPPPVAVPAPAVATPPAPVFVPGYPSLKVQATTIADEPTAQRLALRLRENAVPAAWLQNVNISVTGGNAYLQGVADTQEQHEAIISAVRNCEGVRAVYDQLQVR